jgi:type I restriction enzyme M protein
MTLLTLQQLESHLWGAANILRGRIDSSDFKHYIFGLLFYKRICDVWEEEFEDRLKKYKDKDLAADPEEHRFHVPKGAFWKDVRKQTTNIGEHLNNAFHSIEDANMRLKGVFQDVDFNNKERFPDETLEVLLQHFEAHSLRNCDVEADILGAAYEYLIAQFADDAGKKGGEFYTPKMVVRIIARCLRLDEGMSICDPACGSGGMLLEAYRDLEYNGKNPKSLSLAGQEINLNTWAISQMNLFLHDIDDTDVRRGDTLRYPKHLVSEGSKAIKTFDRVMANPPFSLKEWGNSIWKDGDPFGRDKYGCPPKSYGDLAFVQHMIASVNDNGMVGVVVPHGILFRGGAEGKIRTGMLKDDIVEAVLGLGPNLFYGTGIPAAIVIFNKNKPAKRKGKVLIVNGAEEMVPGKNQNTLSDENVERFAQAFTDFKDEERFCRVVDMEEIEKADYNLNLARYVSLEEEEEPIDVAAELTTLKDLKTQRDTAESKMMELVEGLGYGD